MRDPLALMIILFTLFSGGLAASETLMVNSYYGEYISANKQIGKAGRDFPFRAGPIISLLDHNNWRQYQFESLFGPQNFRAQFHFRPQP